MHLGQYMQSKMNITTFKEGGFLRWNKFNSKTALVFVIRLSKQRDRDEHYYD